MIIFGLLQIKLGFPVNSNQTVGDKDAHKPLRSQKYCNIHSV